MTLSAADSTTNNRALVIGASGFLGSHVVKKLVASGRPVRILVRHSSRLDALEGIDVETYYGDVLNLESLQKAMHGCSTVFHCVVDTRAWLTDPAPLYRCNIDGLVNSMDAALANNIRRFIFTSSIATVGLNEQRPPNETDTFNWRERAPAYILSRVGAEDKLFDYCRDRGLPGIAMCVANTYGPADVQPTPHGELVWQAATGKLPIALNCGAPYVDIRDAADALLLAEERGRTGERYIIAAGYISQRELYALAAKTINGKPPMLLPIGAAHVIAWLTQSIAALLGRKDVKLCTASVLLSHIFKELDASKARTELGWRARPLEESVHDAVTWYSQHQPA